MTQKKQQLSLTLVAYHGQINHVKDLIGMLIFVAWLLLLLLLFSRMKKETNAHTMFN